MVKMFPLLVNIQCKSFRMCRILKRSKIVGRSTKIRRRGRHKIWVVVRGVVVVVGKEVVISGLYSQECKCLTFDVKKSDYMQC
jgi:hypothetical protein